MLSGPQTFFPSMERAARSEQTEVSMAAVDSKLLAIKKKLIKQRQELLAEAGQTLNSKLGAEKESFPDPTDQAVAELDNSFLLRLRGREQKLLKKIDEAVSRIDDGTYGICESCGGRISIKRLEARPVTTLCIECKIRQEEEEKMQAGA
jgi:DnaK suppressor protein